MKVVIVGICASGKSTLAKGLRTKGYEAYNVAQEHSCVKRLWSKRSPDKMIMLDAKLETVRQRRSRPSWTQKRVDLQHERLSDAKANADLYLPTDELTIEEVLEKAENFLG